MRIKFYNYFSFFTILIVLNSCQKEFSFENGSTVIGTGVATYTFTALTGNCVTPVISGGYTINTITTANNTVLLEVKVTVAGTYAITTAVTNGITFSGAGIFTETGTKTMLLTATGTPTNSGTFSYTPSANACSFNIVVNPSGYAIYSFSSASCTPDAIDGLYIQGETLTTYNTVTYTVNVTTTGDYSLATKVINGISFMGSGNFQTTGAHTITLVGTGTPLALGPNTYTPQVNGACPFVITVGSGFLNCKVDSILSSFVYRVNAKQSTPLTIDISGSIGTNSSESILISLYKPITAIVTGDVFNPASQASGKIYLINYTDKTGVTWAAETGTTPNPVSITITKKTATAITGIFSGDISQIGVTGGPIKTITDGAFSIIMQ